MPNLIREEPVRFIAAIQATLALAAIVATQFGVTIPDSVIAAIVVALAAWLSFVTRNQVTPV